MSEAPIILNDQCFDAETGTHYNLLRDYDPTTGRYIESDPIGLDGGSYSTYGYVGGNPIGFSDHSGLAPGGSWLCILPIFGCTYTPHPADQDDSLPPPPPVPNFFPWISQALNPQANYDKAGLKVCLAAQTMKPPGECDPQDQQRMQTEVDNACKRPRSCRPGMNGVELEIMKANSRECAMARDQINKICFKGGDKGHRDAAIDAWQSVANCEGMTE